MAVAVGLRTAAGGTVTGIEETSLRALAKLEQVLPARLRQRVNALQTHTVPITPDGPTVAAEVLTAVAAACRDHEQLRFDYTGRDGVTTERKAEPITLVNWSRRWYLVGWDVDRRDWRTYRADRLRLRTPNGPRCTPREPPGATSPPGSSAGWATTCGRSRPASCCTPRPIRSRAVRRASSSRSATTPVCSPCAATTCI